MPGLRGNLWEAEAGKTTAYTMGRGLGGMGAQGGWGGRGAFWESSNEMIDNGTRGMDPKTTNLKTFLHTFPPWRTGLLTPWGKGQEGGCTEGSAVRPSRKAATMHMVDGMGAQETWVVRPGQTIPKT